MKSNLFKNCLESLKFINELKKNIKLYNEFLEKETRYELIINFLKFFSNNVHLNQLAKDFILKEDYLFLLLGFTNLDEENPLMREWSIVLIRNLTESN